jgi:hypothetical protein
MTWCIVKQKEALYPPICLLLKNVNSVVDLSEEIIGAKVTVAIFARFE